MRTRPWVLPGILAALLSCAVVPGHAQQAAVPEHPIKRGFEAAWSRQPEFQVAELRRDAASQAIEASGRWTPDAVAIELAGKTDRYQSNNGAREYDASLAVPLWLPGERSRSQSAAQAQASAVAAGLTMARWKTAEQVRETYWELARASLETRLAEERLGNARLLASDVARRMRAGDLARADAHQAEGAVAGAEATLAQSQASFAKASRRWRTLTGLESIPDVERHPEATPNVDASATEHPALTQLAAKVELARRQRELAGVQTGSNPELTLGAVRERDESGQPYDHSVIVGIRIPFGSSGANRARVATANAEQLEAEAVLAAERRRLQADLESAWDDLGAMQAAAQAAERRAQLARESRGFYEKSFRLGESDLPTRLRVDHEAFEAERQAAAARIELSAAVSRLRQTLGLLPE